MNASLPDLRLLLKEINRGNCVPFLGAAGNGGVPGPRQLAERLAAEMGYSGQILRLPEVAQRYDLLHKRQALCDRVIEWLGDPEFQPGPVHHLLAQLPFTFFFTTAQHDLLERALRAANRPVTVVIRQEDTGYIDRKRATVIKLFGDIAQPETLILTEKDHLTFLDQSPLLATVVQATLATRTLLFLDYDLADAELRRLFFQVVRGQSRHKRSAYAVWPKPDENQRRFWAEENLRFIDSETGTFLQTIHRELSRLVPEPQPPKPPKPSLPRRPFRFLDAYEPAHADLFAGREQEIETLSQKIQAHRLVVLTGACGTGKTSLLLAGVQPRLAGEDWRMVHVRPLGDPFAALQRALVPLSDDLPAETDLHDLILAAEAATDERLVVAFDQFEEFFLRLGSQAQNAFIAQLAPCLSDPEVDTRFVLSLRDDFFLRLNAFESQVPGIFHNVFVLNRLRREQALAAVMEPLKRVGIELEPGLAERIVGDLDERGVDPPQLQIVCDRLYDDMLARGNRRITVADYERLGGVEELLPAYLSDVLARLPQAKLVLESLVGDQGLKAVRSLPEIKGRVGDEVDDLPAVLGKLMDARLVRSVKEDGESCYELVHDVLAAAIWEWLSEGVREAERARGILERGLSDWRSTDALLNAQRLDFVAARWPFLEAVDSKTQALLLRSTIHLGHNVSLWLERLTDATLNRQVLLEMRAHPDPGTRARVMTCLADLVGVEDEDDPTLAALRRASVEDPETGVRRAATLALHRARGEAAITYLAAQAREGDLSTRSHALGGLAFLGDARLRIWPNLSAGIWPLVAAGVARLRLMRHWPQWGWRVVGATAGGAIGFALGFALLHLLESGLAGLAIYAASFTLPFGAVAGLGCGLGIALAAALADGDHPVPRAIGGIVGGALGCAVGLQLRQSAFGAGQDFAFWPAGLLAGALIGLGLGLSPMDIKRAGFQVIGGAVAGALGFAAAQLLSLVGWLLFLALLVGAIIGGTVGAGLVWADRRSARNTLPDKAAIGIGGTI